jgi:hypothetical protein
LPIQEGKDQPGKREARSALTLFRRSERAEHGGLEKDSFIFKLSRSWFMQQMFTFCSDCQMHSVLMQGLNFYGTSSLNISFIIPRQFFLPF